MLQHGKKGEKQGRQVAMASRNTKSGQKMPPSYYDILMVSPDADMTEIRKAYYKLAKTCHPDRNPRDRRMAELRFRLINEAYDTLKTPQTRAAYDRKRRRMKKQMRNMKADNDNQKRHRNKARSPASRFLSGLREVLWPIHTGETTSRRQRRINDG